MPGGGGFWFCFVFKSGVVHFCTALVLNNPLPSGALVLQRAQKHFTLVRRPQASNSDLPGGLVWFCLLVWLVGWLFGWFGLVGLVGCLVAWWFVYSSLVGSWLALV